jgi:CarD family transcriptional regulator
MSALVFSAGDYVVYPAHGVGKVLDIEKRTIDGQKIDFFVINFERSRMLLRIPVEKIAASGLRRLSTRETMDTALTTLTGRARIRRTMWSRRAQEYEQKINSGNPVAVAEVVRDLHRNENQAEQSYSERQIYEHALERLACELAVLEHIETDAATARLEKLLPAA